MQVERTHSYLVSCWIFIFCFVRWKNSFISSKLLKFFSKKYYFKFSFCRPFNRCRSFSIHNASIHFFFVFLFTSMFHCHAYVLLSIPWSIFVSAEPLLRICLMDRSNYILLVVFVYGHQESLKCKRWNLCLKVSLIKPSSLTCCPSGN